MWTWRAADGRSPAGSASIQSIRCDGMYAAWVGASGTGSQPWSDGFARTVALSVLAANLHRIGSIPRERKRQRLVA